MVTARYLTVAGEQAEREFDTHEEAFDFLANSAATPRSVHGATGWIVDGRQLQDMLLQYVKPPVL